MPPEKLDKKSEELLEEIRGILQKSVELQQAAIEQDRARNTATDDLTAYAELEAGLAKQRTGYSQERTALVRAQTRFTTRSTELAEIRTDLALERGRLAMERTELATLRTEYARIRNALAQQRNEMAQERTHLAETRTQLSTLNTTYAKTRVELARSRTELAIIRTGAALSTFAIALVAVNRYFPVQDLWWNVFLVALGVAGAVALGVGLAYYWHTWSAVRYLDRTNERQESQIPVVSGLVRARSENGSRGISLLRRR